MTTITISLPNQIAKKIDNLAKKQGFATRSEFVRSLLRNYLAREELVLEKFEPVPLEQLKLELAQTGKYSEKFINSVISGFARYSIYEGKTSKS